MQYYLPLLNIYSSYFSLQLILIASFSRSLFTNSKIRMMIESRLQVLQCWFGTIFAPWLSECTAQGRCWKTTSPVGSIAALFVTFGGHWACNLHDNHILQARKTWDLWDQMQCLQARLLGNPKYTFLYQQVYWSLSLIWKGWVISCRKDFTWIWCTCHF